MVITNDSLVYAIYICLPIAVEDRYIFIYKYFYTMFA